jgi:hypothetical protein
MTPKEKGYEIFFKFCDYADYNNEDCCLTEIETMRKNAKSLSLITIDEVINAIDPFGQFLGKDYWLEVKKNINNINL